MDNITDNLNLVDENKRLLRELADMTKKKQKFKQKYLRVKENISHQKIGGGDNYVRSIFEPNIDKYINIVKSYVSKPPLK